MRTLPDSSRERIAIRVLLTNFDALDYHVGQPATARLYILCVERKPTIISYTPQDLQLVALRNEDPHKHVFVNKQRRNFVCYIPRHKNKQNTLHLTALPQPLNSTMSISFSNGSGSHDYAQSSVPAVSLEASNAPVIRPSTSEKNSRFPFVLPKIIGDRKTTKGTVLA